MEQQYQGLIGTNHQEVLKVKEEAKSLGKKIVTFMNTKTGIMRIFFM